MHSKFYVVERKSLYILVNDILAHPSRQLYVSVDEYVESDKSNVSLNDSCKNFACSAIRNSLSNLHNSDVLDDPSKLSLFESYSNNESLISNNDINFNNSSNYF